MKRAINETVDDIVDRLPEELIEAWQERSAIREYDGGFSRPHAEALALLDLIEDEPDVLSELRVYQVNVDRTPRYFIGAEHLLREHADLLGGEVAARRHVAWALEHDFGNLAEVVLAA